MTRDLVISALRMTRFRRKPNVVGLIHHSDRGSHYASHDFQAVLKEYGMTASMSQKGNCWDYAPMESFFNSLKNERTHHQRYVTREEARHDTFEYIECFTIRVVATPRWGARVRQRSTLLGFTKRNWRLNGLRLVVEKQG